MTEARRQAVLEYFVAHPGATGDEVQQLLVSGKLTGEKGPSISTGMLYELRKRALAMVNGAGGPPAGAPAGVSAAALDELRERARALQEALARVPGVSQVVITRDGARIVRLEPREEKL